VRRGSKRIVSAALFRLHVYFLFTLLGLSLPYRIWFAKHCDEIRVTVVKETSIEESPPAKVTKETAEKSSWFPLSWGWGSQSSSATARAQELFRKRMRELSLYDEEKPPSSEGPSTLLQVTNLSDGTERDWNEAMADQASISMDTSSPGFTGSNDLDAAPSDSQPASLISAQPSSASSTSPS
jgi:hypothetical protein